MRAQTLAKSKRLSLMLVLVEVVTFGCY